jgi:hypothetical protein
MSDVGGHENTKKRRDDDGDCVRFATRHGEKLDEKTLARLLAVAESVASRQGRATSPDDPRFHY